MDLTAMMSEHRMRREMLGAWAVHDAGIYRRFIQSLSQAGCRLDRASILDIGCGSNAPITLMLHSAGLKVVGIDGYLGYRWGLGFKPQRYWRYLGEAGCYKAARKVLGEWVYDRQYYLSLSQATGLLLTERGLDLRAMNAENMKLEDGSFDVAFSNAAWEHFPDVRQANRELARVLRSGGLAYIEIHLFASLSGGHDLPWIVPGKIDRGDIRPWRHLRDSSWQAPVFLNRLREKEFRELFLEEDRFEILNWQTEFKEGEELISDEILKELPEYKAEELTKRSVIAILRKR